MKKHLVTCMLVALIGAAALGYLELKEASATPNPVRTETTSGDPVLVGAGDIASCGSPGDETTATILDGIPGTVFTAGDNAYDYGTTREFRRCYDPS